MIGGGPTGMVAGSSAAHPSKDQIQAGALVLTAPSSSGCRCPSRFLESSVRVASNLRLYPRDAPSIGQGDRRGCHRRLLEEA